MLKGSLLNSFSYFFIIKSDFDEDWVESDLSGFIEKGGWAFFGNVLAILVRIRRVPILGIVRVVDTEFVGAVKMLNFMFDKFTVAKREFIELFLLFFL